MFYARALAVPLLAAVWMRKCIGQHWIPNFPLFHSNTAYQFHSWNTRFYYCLKKHKESALTLFLFLAHIEISTFIQPKTSILFIFSTGLNDIDMKVLMTFFGSYRLFAIFFCNSNNDFAIISIFLPFLVYWKVWVQLDDKLTMDTNFFYRTYYAS